MSAFGLGNGDTQMKDLGRVLGRGGKGRGGKGRETMCEVLLCAGLLAENWKSREDKVASALMLGKDTEMWKAVIKPVL